MPDLGGRRAQHPEINCHRSALRKGGERDAKPVSFTLRQVAEADAFLEAGRIRNSHHT